MNPTNPQEATFVRWFRDLNQGFPGFLKPLLGFSLAVNVLLMVSPLYMLQIYDRVLTSGSSDTLVWLTAIAVFLMSIYAVAEAARRRLCALAAETLEDQISERVFRRFDDVHQADTQLTQNLLQLSKVRSLFQNQLINPFFDLPFAPGFLLVLFLVHPLIGTVGLVGAIVVFAVAVIAELNTRHTNQQANAASTQAFELANGLARQRSAMVAMGLVDHTLGHWRQVKQQARALNLDASAREGGFSASSRALRQILQVLILAAGAGLALSQDVSAGAIVAGSIILSRALAPIDQIVGSWRAITQAKNAWDDLLPIIQHEPQYDSYTPLPKPEPKLQLDRLAVATPDAQAALIRPFSINLSAPQMVAIVGANGSGKTTLLQTLAGAWMPRSGTVSLGGRNVHDWPNVDRGQYVGYVPQDVELLPGSVAQNIARMSDADHELVIDAAKQAGAHDMILTLQHGYDTQIGSAHAPSLSAGQRQLIGLARALFGEPSLLLLDEPTANLDPQAANALIQRLGNIAREQAIVITATHDQSLIQATDNVLLIRNGSMIAAKPGTLDQSAVATPIHRSAQGVSA